MEFEILGYSTLKAPQESSVLKSALSDSRPERADFRPERTDFRPESACGAG